MSSFGLQENIPVQADNWSDSNTSDDSCEVVGTVHTIQRRQGIRDCPDEPIRRARGRRAGPLKDQKQRELEERQEWERLRAYYEQVSLCTLRSRDPASSDRLYDLCAMAALGGVAFARLSRPCASVCSYAT
jgi:hypothetical protein